MSANSEAATVIAHATLRLSAGFRFAAPEALAGVPLKLEFFVRNSGLETAYLAVGGDRARGRPDFFSFSARFAGWPLTDPASDGAYHGGPLGLVTVAPGDTYRQPILLNEFLRLEDAIARLLPGGHGELELTCERRLPCGANEGPALDVSTAPLVKVGIACTLRREDSALLRTLDELAATILHGPIEQREPALAALFASRALAREQLLRVAAHPDRNCAERARRVLAALSVDR
jgi:hypothetical protein